MAVSLGPPTWEYRMEYKSLSYSFLPFGLVLSGELLNRCQELFPWRPQHPCQQTRLVPLLLLIPSQMLRLWLLLCWQLLPDPFSLRCHCLSRDSISILQKEEALNQRS